MSQRFNRAVKVSIASRLDNASRGKDERFFNKFTQLTTIEQLRVSFEITKTLKQDPNVAKIKIYNLSEKTRSEFQTLPAHLTLEAGHGSELKALYKGDITSGISKPEPPEWVTDILAGTGANAVRHARIGRSFKAGISVADMVKAGAKAMGLKRPQNITDAKTLLGTIKNGVTMSGPAMRELQKTLAPKGYNVSIQDDQLVALRDGDTRQVTAIVVSQATGMIGSPELGTPEAKGKAPILKVRMMIAPDLTPGGVIELEAARISGSFKVLQVKHTGDTHTNPWYSDIEAIAL